MLDEPREVADGREVSLLCIQMKTSSSPLSLWVTYHLAPTCIRVLIELSSLNTAEKKLSLPTPRFSAEM